MFKKTTRQQANGVEQNIATAPTQPVGALKLRPAAQYLDGPVSANNAQTNMPRLAAPKSYVAAFAFQPRRTGPIFAGGNAMIRTGIDTQRLFRQAFPTINEETVNELVRRGLLHLAEHKWRFGDANNGTTRRLDRRKWKRANNSGADWHRLIGLDDVIQHDRRRVIFVIEGSKDALAAAAELTRRCGILAEVGIVCALGGGYRPVAAQITRVGSSSTLTIVP